MYRLELDVMPKAKALINAVVKGNTKYSLENRMLLGNKMVLDGLGGKVRYRFGGISPLPCFVKVWGVRATD